MKRQWAWVFGGSPTLPAQSLWGGNWYWEFSLTNCSFQHLSRSIRCPNIWMCIRVWTNLWTNPSYVPDCGSVSRETVVPCRPICNVGGGLQCSRQDAEFYCGCSVIAKCKFPRNCGCIMEIPRLISKTATALSILSVVGVVHLLAWTPHCSFQTLEWMENLNKWRALSTSNWKIIQ